MPEESDTSRDGKGVCFEVASAYASGLEAGVKGKHSWKGRHGVWTGDRLTPPSVD